MKSNSSDGNPVSGVSGSIRSKYLQKQRLEKDLNRTTAASSVKRPIAPPPSQPPDGKVSASLSIRSKLREKKQYKGINNRPGSSASSRSISSNNNNEKIVTTETMADIKKDTKSIPPPPQPPSIPRPPPSSLLRRGETYSSSNTPSVASTVRAMLNNPGIASLSVTSSKVLSEKEDDENEIIISDKKLEDTTDVPNELLSPHHPKSLSFNNNEIIQSPSNNILSTNKNNDDEVAGNTADPFSPLTYDDNMMEDSSKQDMRDTQHLSTIEPKQRKQTTSTYPPPPAPPSQHNTTMIMSPMKNLKVLLNSVSSINQSYNNTPTSHVSSSMNNFGEDENDGDVDVDVSSLGSKSSILRRNNNNAIKQHLKPTTTMNSNMMTNTPTNNTALASNASVFSSSSSTTTNSSMQDILMEDDNYDSEIDSDNDPACTASDGIYTQDPTCIKYNSNITLRMHYADPSDKGIRSICASSILSPEDNKKFEAKPNGNSLSTSTEILKVMDASSTTTGKYYNENSDENSNNASQNEKVVCYGDVIALVSNYAYDRALGVRSAHKSSSGTSSSSTKEYNLGFYRSLLGQAEKWVVLWAGGSSSGEKYPIEVGSIANTDRESNDGKRRHSKRRRRRRRRRPVRSGDAIVIRNLGTGGILALHQQKIIQSNSNRSRRSEGLPHHQIPSLWNTDDENKEWDLTVLTQAPIHHTSSIVSNNNNKNEGSSSSALPHPSTGAFHLIIPGIHETWQFQMIDTPPQPNWVSERSFLNGRFLLESKRNRFDHESAAGDEKELFGDCTTNEPSTTHSRSYNEKPIQHCNVMEQESILLEEILGALMGLEGSHIKPILNEESKENTQEITLDSDKNRLNSTLLNSWLDTNGGGETEEFNTIQRGIQDTFHPSPLNSIDTIVFGLFEDTTTTHPHDSSQQHHPKAKIDPSLRHLIEQILPVCSNYTFLNAFVLSRRQRYEYGLVSQAFLSAIHSLLQEYLVFICQMENLLFGKQLSMHKLWCFLQPTLKTLQVLTNTCRQVHRYKGGQLLNALIETNQRMYDGDERANEILQFLVEKASVPYFQMLETWIYQGDLQDPYQEFFIYFNNCEDMSISSERGLNFYHRNRNNKRWTKIMGRRDSTTGTALDGDNWDIFYQIRKEQVLTTLIVLSGNTQSGGDLIHQILTAGKYLNVLRHENKSTLHHQQTTPSLQAQDQTTTPNNQRRRRITYEMGPIQINKQIQNAYTQSAKALLNLILRDNSLLKTLTNIKKYFLLSQGDFFVQFLDLAEQELFQQVNKVSKGRIQNLLSMAISQVSSSGGGGGGDEPFLDELKCDFAHCSVVNHLDHIHADSGGIDAANQNTKTPKRTVYGGGGSEDQGLTAVEAFMLDIHNIQWPLSLIISRKAIASYQLIFRHLFLSKHVERRLFETWLDHQTTKELNLRSILGSTYLLRQRMLHFMQNFVYYVMFEVIEPHWHQMKNDIQKTQTIDDVLRIHSRFLTETHKECLLMNRELLKTLTKIMQTCLLFSDQMRRFAKSTKIDEENMKIAVEERKKRIMNASKEEDNKNNSKSKSKNDNIQKDNISRRARIKHLTERMQKAIKSENYQRMISRFSQVFDSQLGDFMSQLTHHGYYNDSSPHLSNLCTRLDFNGFVTRALMMGGNSGK